MEAKKKGFTLIELLATIVVIAVIALITTPIVLNIIEVTRKGAFARSAEGVLKASKLYYSASLIEDITPNKNTFTCNNKECLSNNGVKLDVDGNMGSGDVTIKEDGKIFFTLTNGKYCAVKYEEDSNIVIKKGNCSNIDLINDTTPPIIKNITVNTTTNSITIVVSAEDQESGIHHYEYSKDGGQTYEEGKTNTKTFSDLEKKDYEVKVRVYNKTYGKDNYSDKTGMTESDIVLTKLKDIELPEIKVTPEEWSTSKEVSIEYYGAIIQEYSLDGEATFSSYEGPFTIEKNGVITAKASDGTNSITKSKQITKIDNEKPTIKVSDISNTYSTKDEITLTLSDNLSGVTHYCVTNINSSDSCNWLEGKDIVTYEISANGTYYAFSKDLVGNISEGQEFVIDKIDTEKPTAKLEVENVTTNSITVKATCTDNIGISKYEYSKNNGVDYVVGQNETYTFEGLTTGTYNLKVRCSDEAGNSAEASAIGTTNNIDKISVNISDSGVWSTSKIVTIQYPNNNKLVNNYTIINGTVTKEDGTVLEAGKTYTASSLSEKIIFTSNGNISAQSSDGINTVTSGSLLVSKIDTTVPTMSNFTVTSKTTTTITVKASGTDNESGIKHYAFSKDNGLTWTSVQEEDSYTFNGLTQYTDYQIKVRVYNGTYASGGRLYKDSEMQTIKTNAETYTITLNGNGATTAGSANTKVTYASSTLSAITKPQRKYTVSFSLGSTGASGTTTAKTSTYTLNGWYTAASGGEKIINSDGTLVASTSYTNASRQWTKTSNVTLYAQWTSQSVTLPTVTKTGNTCKWGSYTSGATMAPTSNTTLTAICTANTYTITFNANGGQTSTSSKKVTYGSTYGDLPVPTYSGYTFLGWYTSATGGTNVINTTNVSITSNQTLYAQWKVTCSNVDDNGNCITATTYKTGDAITLGGYKWHVIGDTGSQVTLLMDAGQLGNYSNMSHCTSANDSSNNCTYNGANYVYRWDESQIMTYLNGTFLANLKNKVKNEIVSTSICVDPSRGAGETTSYGGYLMSELDALGKKTYCTRQSANKVRLISYSEYYNMSPKYTSQNADYPNIENITKISTTSDYKSWLYCSSANCGNSQYGNWWTMSSYSNGRSTTNVIMAITVTGNGNLESKASEVIGGVRPVITIVK